MSCHWYFWNALVRANYSVLVEGEADYRRTLYWNPDVRLNETGEARISFYNNSRTTHMTVDAHGQSQDGTLLWYR